MAILTEARVMTIRSQYAQGNISQSALAKQHGISQASVGLLITGRTWKHLPLVPYPKRTGRGPVGERNPNTKLTDADVIHARHLRTLNFTNDEIAGYFNVNKAYMCGILTGRNRRFVK